MFTRAGNDWTARFNPIAAIPATPKTRAAYVDGEIAVVTAEGVSDFGALQEALGRHGGSAELSISRSIFYTWTAATSGRCRCQMALELQRNGAGEAVLLGIGRNLA